jgi:sec-independent protein translocase protein TatB
MFDIGFSELLVIGVVALVVIGPERLPRVARTAGHLFGRLQRYVTQVKSDIQHEIQLDEFKQMRSQLEESVAKTEFEIVDEVRKLETGVKAAAGIEEPVAGSNSAPAIGSDTASPSSPPTDSNPHRS